MRNTKPNNIFAMVYVSDVRRWRQQSYTIVRPKAALWSRFGAKERKRSVFHYATDNTLLTLDITECYKQCWFFIAQRNLSLLTDTHSPNKSYYIFVFVSYRIHCAIVEIVIKLPPALHQANKVFRTLFCVRCISKTCSTHACQVRSLLFLVRQSYSLQFMKLIRASSFSCSFCLIFWVFICVAVIVQHVH